VSEKQNLIGSYLFASNHFLGYLTITCKW